MLETAGGVLVRGRRKRGHGGRKEVVEQACGRPTACVSLQQQEEAEVVEAELLRRLFARHVETPPSSSLACFWCRQEKSEAGGAWRLSSYIHTHILTSVHSVVGPM